MQSVLLFRNENGYHDLRYATKVGTSEIATDRLPLASVLLAVQYFFYPVLLLFP